MQIRFERRPAASRPAMVAVPLVTLVLTGVAGTILLLALGKSPAVAAHSFLIEPFASVYSFSEVLLKFGPLLLIAQGLAIGFRAKVWNIGAEGQMVVGAIAASAVPIHFNDSGSILILPLMILLGALGGMFWAGIAAFLRVRFNANEILVTLMLSSVAFQLLYYLVLGPWRDPMGFNFPQSAMFQNAALYPVLIPGTRLNVSIVIPILVTVAAWVYMQRHFGGFKLLVGGLAPQAAGYAGFSAGRAVWISLLVAGAAAGVAGMGEVAGPIGQLQREITSGYGYSGIIVAYLGGLHPVGIVFAAFLMAVIQIGGDIALVSADIPISLVRVLQGLLLAFYLATYTFVHYRLRFVRRAHHEARA
jgi:ABC-type uncharacterized transport system permease subunit